MAYINWGSESPEQLEIRRRFEEQALYEQAARSARARTSIAVAGGSSSIQKKKFTSTWNTLFGDGAPTVILPLIDSGVYDFVVDWGDGTSNIITSWNAPEIEHTYSTGGTYTVIISGVIEGWSFKVFDLSDTGMKEKIISITHWGQLRLGASDNSHFSACINLDLSEVSDVLDLTGTTDLISTFFRYSQLKINRIEEWNVANIIDMRSLFQNSGFNGNISGWNVASVTNMDKMFAGAADFNQDLSRWCVTSIPVEPAGFDDDAFAWGLPRPVWGTCPS